MVKLSEKLLLIYFYVIFFILKGFLKDGDVFCGIVANCDTKRIMHFLKNGNVIQHTINNLPSDGVIIGVYIYICI
jgi:hypothetical protein